jgi:hypothetical protein
MPTASDELRAEFLDENGRHSDKAAIQHLESRNFKRVNSWWWKPPDNHIFTKRDLDAVNYLVDEWDWGGLAEMAH